MIKLIAKIICAIPIAHYSGLTLSIIVSGIIEKFNELFGCHLIDLTGLSISLLLTYIIGYLAGMFIFYKLINKL